MKKIFDVLNVIKQKLFVKKDKIIQKNIIAELIF